MIVDTPPGTRTSISIVQYLKHSLQDGRDGCVVITTPQEASMGDVARSSILQEDASERAWHRREHVWPYVAAREQERGGNSKVGIVNSEGEKT